MITRISGGPIQSAGRNTNPRGRLAVYATKPKHPASPYETKYVVRVDVTAEGYGVYGASFPFTQEESGWNLEQPFFISPISPHTIALNEQFEKNFNSRGLAENAWREALQNNGYRKAYTIIRDGTPDENHAQTPVEYLWIPLVKFLPKSSQIELVQTIGNTLPKSLDALVLRLQPRKPFGRQGKSLDRDYIPPGIAFSQDGILLHFIDTGYSSGKQYTMQYNQVDKKGIVETSHQKP